MTKCLYVQILALLFSNSAFAKARVDAPLKIAIIQSKSEGAKTLNKEFKRGCHNSHGTSCQSYSQTSKTRQSS